MIDQNGGVYSWGSVWPNVVSQIATVRQQLRLGPNLPVISVPAFPRHQRGPTFSRMTPVECLHASNAEVHSGGYNPIRCAFEAIHRPLAENNDNSDLWRLNDLGTGKFGYQSWADGHFLHASNTLVTGQGHKYLYTCAANNIDHAEEFSIIPFDTPEPVLPLVGYFKLASIRD